MRRLAIAVLFIASLSACTGGSSKPVPSFSGPTGAPSPFGHLLPETARVVCSDGGIEILTPVVQPRPDGVWISVTNASQVEVRFDPGPVRPGDVELSSSGDNFVAPHATKVMRWFIVPGSTEASCVSPTGPASNTFTISDLLGLFRPLVGPYGCTEATYAFSTRVDFASTEEVFADVRRELTGVRSDDVLTRVGYPQQPHVWVSITRQERAIALVSLQPTVASDSGSSITVCVDAGIRPRQGG
jgi:hypothetical protein